MNSRETTNWYLKKEKRRKKINKNTTHDEIKQHTYDLYNILSHAHVKREKRMKFTNTYMLYKIHTEHTRRNIRIYRSRRINWYRIRSEMSNWTFA